MILASSLTLHVRMSHPHATETAMKHLYEIMVTVYIFNQSSNLYM